LTVLTQVGKYLTKKQQLKAAKARANTVLPNHNPGLLFNEGSSRGDPAIMEQIIMSPDSFRVFYKYLSLSSHNSNNIDPFFGIPFISSGCYKLDPFGIQ